MELPRTRDVITLVKGQTFPVALGAGLLGAGWPGGQGVMWIDASYDTFMVDFSDGVPSGFLLWGSNETADQYSAYTENQPTYKFAVLCYGTWLISTSSYERYTYQSRTLGGPLVPIVYNPSDRLLFSLRGLWTNEDEMTLSGALLAPAVHTGFVCQLPKVVNQFFLGVHTRL